MKKECAKRTVNPLHKAVDWLLKTIYISVQLSCHLCKAFSVGFFWETTYARSFKFCMTIAAIELYTFITVLGTLAGCQGHIGVSERWHWQIPWFCFLETIAERALLFTLSVSCQFDDNDPFWRSHFQDNFLYNAPTFHGPPQPLCKSMDECETIKASPYKIYYT